MKKLDKNPLYLYTGAPCIICDSELPVSDTIEGCDWVQDKVIAERVDWEPEIIKPVLRSISDMTLEEANYIANLAWSPADKRPVEMVEIQKTDLFPFAAIYFNWGAEEVSFWNENGTPTMQSTPQRFVLSLENGQDTIKLFQIVPSKFIKDGEDLKFMPVYQSHKITVYLIQQHFDIGLLEPGTFIIRNKNNKIEI